MKKIEARLVNYERDDKIDNWIIDFKVGLNYEILTFDCIIEKHDKLMQSGSCLEHTHLLLCSERGRLYDKVKYSAQWSGQWRKLCKRMKVCHVTANRYIDFFRITNAYPRLIICGLNLETIMHLYNEILNHLTKKENYELGIRLALPLRTTTIKTKNKLHVEKLQGGEPPLRLLSESSE